METSVVVKVFTVLEVLAREGAELSLGGIAAEVALPKPTVHRLLAIMVDQGYVVRRDGGRYALSSKMRTLAFRGRSGQLLTLAEPILLDLHRATGETVNLGVLKQDQIVYLRVVESEHPLRRVVEPGSADPFYSTALGRAIVSHLPDKEQSDLLKQIGKITKRTPYTVGSAAEVEKIFAKVRRQGYAVEKNETDIGVTCIGAPVSEQGKVVAAISLSVPTARLEHFGESKLVRLILEATERLSESLSPAEVVA